MGIVLPVAIFLILLWLLILAIVEKNKKAIIIISIIIVIFSLITGYLIFVINDIMNAFQ